MKPVEEIKSVTAAEVIIDGKRVWAKAYPNATKAQAESYAENSFPAQKHLNMGYPVTIRLQVFGQTDDIVERTLLPTEKKEVA